MEFCNPKCPQPKRMPNCGGCSQDTSCGMPPKTIMPCPVVPDKCDKPCKGMMERKMCGTMPGQNMAMMPDRNLMNTMPARNMNQVMPAKNVNQMMPDCGAPCSMPAWNNSVMPDMAGGYQPDNSGCCNNYPVAMAYVPWQRWQQPYSMEKGFRRGTIFPDLDLPFVMGRCQ